MKNETNKWRALCESYEFCWELIVHWTTRLQAKIVLQNHLSKPAY
jgi:hypothetical protein